MFDHWLVSEMNMIPDKLSAITAIPDNKKLYTVYLSPFFFIFLIKYHYQLSGSSSVVVEKVPCYGLGPKR